MEIAKLAAFTNFLISPVIAKTRRSHLTFRSLSNRTNFPQQWMSIVMHCFCQVSVLLYWSRKSKNVSTTLT